MGVGLRKTDADGIVLDTSDTVDDSSVTLASLAHTNAKDMRLIVIEGQDSSGGPLTFGHSQAVKDWNIINYIRFNNNDPGGSAADAEGAGAVSDFFVTPLTASGAIVQKIGHELNGYRFLLVMQSP